MGAQKAAQREAQEDEARRRSEHTKQAGVRSFEEIQRLMTAAPELSSSKPSSPSTTEVAVAAIDPLAGSSMSHGQQRQADQQLMQQNERMAEALGRAIGFINVVGQMAE